MLCKVSPSAIDVSYTARNTCTEPVFACGVPIDAARRQYPDQAYCALSEDRTKLVLTLGFSTLPSDRQVEVAICGLYHRLGVGEKLEGTISISLPVLEWNAYSLAVDTASTSDVFHVNQVLLKMASIRESEALRVTQVSQSGLYVVVGRPLYVSRTAVLLTKIPVVEREWKFPREKVIGTKDQ